MYRLLSVFLIVLLFVFFFPIRESLAACSKSYAGKSLVTRWQPVDITNNWTYDAQTSSGQSARAGILDPIAGLIADPECFSSQVENQYGDITEIFGTDTGFKTYFPGTYKIYINYLGSGTPSIDQGATLNVTMKATPTPIPCPYASIEPAIRVKIKGEWQEWKNSLNINQWQTDDIQAAVFYNGSSNFVNLDKVQMVFSGTILNSNPANVSPLISGVSYYGVGGTGIGICSNLITKTASLSVLYCPYREVIVNSIRGRSGDPWLPDVTINKKDVKTGTVQSGTYYNNGSGNQWASLNNLSFNITKPGGEISAFNNNPKVYPIPQSWYTSGFYLNYPGTYSLKATATNNGSSCGDYPPENRGTINVINCSYDTTVAGFQNVASPPPAWTGSLYLPFTGATVKSAGFHDRSLSSIPPAVDDIKVFTPPEQVILRISGPGSVDQRADQGAPFTYTLGGAYTLSVTTPDLDTPNSEDIENGVGCYDSASLNLGGEPPANACVNTEERIPCCPFRLSGTSLWNGLVSLLNKLVVYLSANNALAPFKMGVSVDKIEFTADRTKQANLLFGQKKSDGTLEPGSVFKLSPPGAIGKCNIRTDASSEDKITKRDTRVSWDVSLEGGSTPLKEGDIADVDPAACASDQIQGYLTRLPGVGVTPTSSQPQNLTNSPQSISLRAEIGSKVATPPSGKVLAESVSNPILTPINTPTPTPTPVIPSTNSCQESLSRPVKSAECYESGSYSAEPNSDVSNLLLILQNSTSLIARVSSIDVLSRSLVGAVTVCDTTGRGCTDQTISQNAGALDLFKVPGGKNYKNIAAEGKISPIRFTVEVGSPIYGIPGPVMIFLAIPKALGGYGIPLTGSGTIPADQFSPDLKDCSVVYTGQGTFSDINSPKLSCVYIINDPELKARYWGSVQSAFYNTNLTSAEPGVQCKLDIPGGTVCAAQDSPPPIVTPPPGFTGSCNICNFNRGGPGRTFENLLDEVAGSVGTPASVLAGMLNFEGYVPDNPDPGKRHIFNYSDEEIAAISAPGASMDYCAESYVGARGPCQFMPSQWNTYGDTIKNYGYTHTPNICNLRDCLYASAAKMRDDAGRLGTACSYNNSTPPPSTSCNWTPGNAAKSAYHYYGACTDNYVSTVVNYYYNYTCQSGQAL